MLSIEVCVPGAAAFEAALQAFKPDPAFTVVRASVTCGSHRCIALPGDSFGSLATDRAVDAVRTHLSSYSPYANVQRDLKHAIVEEFSGELPVGCAVMVMTQHPKHRTLVYAPVTRVPGEPHCSFAPYLSFRAALLRLAGLVRRGDVRGLSVPLFGEAESVERVCQQMMHARSSLARVPEMMRSEDYIAKAAEDHGRLVGLSPSGAEKLNG